MNRNVQISPTLRRQAMSRAISFHAEKAGRVIFNTHLSILLTKKKIHIFKNTFDCTDSDVGVLEWKCLQSHKKCLYDNIYSLKQSAA